jgi:predicted ester cyclase
VTLDDERPTMELHRTAFPDKHTEIHLIVADDESVACQCTVTATHTGRYFDAEPTDKRVVVHEMMFNRVRGSRLAENWAMTAGPGFYQQITGRPAPPAVDNLG